MSFRPVQAACLLLLVAGQAGAGLSTWDEIQLQLLQQYSTPLRWDNLEGPPHWVSGPKPRYQFSQRLHFIHLQPGEAVTLHASANTWLRLAGETKTLRREDLKIGVSTDARMFVETSPIRTIDPHSLLVELPHHKPSLVRLTRPPQAQSNLVFAAYFSRLEQFNTMAPYRKTVRLPGKAVRLRREGEAASQPAWLLKPEEGIEFSLKGPARLQLAARLQWPRSEPPREQSLVLQVSLDESDPVPLLLCPELDARRRTRVNRSSEMVSGQMNGFFNVPAGRHHLRLQATAPVYLSVFRQSHPDLLLPWLNGPATNAMQLLRSTLGQVPDVSALAFRPWSPPLSAGDLVTMEQQAWRLACDNQTLQSGAQAADWLSRLGQGLQDYPAARRSAETLWRQRTSYQEVLPARLAGGQPLRKALFAPDRVRPLFQPEQRIAVCNPTLEQVDAMLAEGHFATVPPRLSPGLLYELPARAYDSRLRIAAMASASTPSHLLVQFDQETPFKVMLDAATALPREELAASDAFATLRVLEQEAHLPTNGAFAYSFGEFDLPFPIVEPGVIELPLPQHVRHVRILLQAAAAPVLTSVAYRTAKPFQFGEMGYLALLHQVDSAAGLQMLAHPQDSSPKAPVPLRELRNHLLPLNRLMRAHFSDFTNNLDLASLSSPTGTPIGSEEASTLKRSALNLEEDNQLIEATEIWNRLFWKGATADQLEAALAIMRCLKSLGEEFLASQYARYALLKSPGPQIPAPAVALLENSARQTGDTEKLEQLRASLFLRCPCPGHLAGLTEALTLNGRDRLALSSGLILPRESRPAEVMLGAALHENWWQTFDQLVEGLPENDARCYWRAQKHLAFYHFAEAEQELRQANDRGREMLQALQEGQQIREQLAAVKLKERLEALLAWEQWQLRQPGPRTWETARDILPECFTTELLFNCEQNRLTPYLRAEREEPVKLCFLGPLRLRVEARPILRVPFKEPVNDWLEVAEYGVTNRVPVSQCVPSPSLQFTTSRSALVGVKTVAMLEWGPGWHEVEVALAGHPGLIRVLQEQPVLPMRILPTLNADRMNLVLQAGRKPSPVQSRARAGKLSNVWWVRSGSAHPTSLLRNASSQTNWVMGIAEHGAAEDVSLTDIEKLHLAVRMESEPGPALEYDSDSWQGLPAFEQWLTACRGKRWKDFTNWTAVPVSAQVSTWLATGRVQELLDSEAPRDVLQRLITLLEISELFPEWRERAQCLAEWLVDEADCPRGAKRVLFRITRDRTWTPLKVSPLSAGIKPLQVPSDLPQNPSTRLRRALLPPARTNEFTLSRQSVFTASMSLQHPARLQLHAELVKAGFSPPTPLTVSLQVDADAVQHLSLLPSEPETSTNFMLSEGPHLVRMWVEDPVVNQFVRIRLSGSSEELTNTLWSQSLAEAASERRFFHAATPAQPVRFSWRGPALLRVDECREGRFVSQLCMVEDGEQTAEIPSAPGRTESWYQIFVRSTQTNQSETRVASVFREPEEVPPPKLHLPASAGSSHAQLTDYYRLGGQEGGTWTPSALLAHRRPFEISRSQSTVENEFLEANVAYRKVAPSETLWFRTKALGRLHQPGDLTFGLSERIEAHPQTLPFDWSWTGEAFVGTAGPQQQDIQWALHTQLKLGERFHLNRKLDWYPFAGLFAHYLSLDPAAASGYDYIDQDLYTPFRYEHRWGGALGNRLEYRPWLDTLFKAGAYLKSNEDFAPDNWGMRFSWTQLMGPFYGEVAYQFRHFLKDADRSSESLLHGISAGLYAEYWIGGRHRIELGGQYRHDWPDSGDSYFLVLRWDFSQGRHYKDYSPHETVFRDLRSRRIPGVFNNLLQPGLPGANLP